MKRILVTLMAMMALTVMHAQDTPYYKYRVYLTDKKNSQFSTRHPEAFLSDRALQRRKAQGIKIDETDIPVNASYMEQIAQQGVKVLISSKWNNTVLVQTDDTTLIDRVAALPFVKSTRKVASYKEFKRANRTNKNVTEPSADASNPYGLAFTQINQLNGITLHNAGYKGAGMVIAVIDGGFTNADIIPGFKNTKILGTHDFVDSESDIFAENSHGTMVLSCIGANIPGYQIGTAPEAEFWLLRSEDGATEQLVEEDYWCSAVEFADSVGADVLNSSLGYTEFDNKADNTLYSELDGHTHINSISASMLASKGIILCNSAGNSGNDQWKKIGTPADASDILAVGAVNSEGNNTLFSSLGNSSDGRIKPDVCAMGEKSAVYATNGRFTAANGTSFSSPIMSGMVACLWQALPHLNAYQIMDIIRKSGNRAQNPDNVYGYGIPDFYRAYIIGLTY